MADNDDRLPAAAPAAAAAIDSRLLDAITHWRYFSGITQICMGQAADGSSPARMSTVTVYTLIDSADNATVYLGTVEAPRREVSLDQAKQSLARLPDEAIYPVLPPQLRACAVTSLPESTAAFYLKRPKILNYKYHIGSTFLADHFLEEADILDRLRRHPHPHLGVCEGYWTPPGKGGRMAGIVLRRYKTTLRDHVDAKRRPDSAQAEADEAVPAARYMEQLRAAAAHLHGMGLAHNDINPRNVMLDDNDRVVLIDLGSCKPLGEALSEFGTPPFNEGFADVSAQANDEIGLTAVQKWLGLPVT